MKKTILLLFVFLGGANLNAQDTTKINEETVLQTKIREHFGRLNIKPKTPQDSVEYEISTLLFKNRANFSFKDSVALYTFAIKIKGRKRGSLYNVDSIKCVDSLYYKLFPNMDHLMKKNDFGVFVKKQGTSQIIIPVAIFVTAHDQMPKNSTLNIWDMPKRINALFALNDNLKYDSIYLTPIIIMIDNQVYN